MGGEEFKTLLCQGGMTRKLLLLMTTVFTAILLLQYVELPNGAYFISSIFANPWRLSNQLETTHHKSNYNSTSAEENSTQQTLISDYSSNKTDQNPALSSLGDEHSAPTNFTLRHETPTPTTIVTPVREHNGSSSDSSSPTIISISPLPVTLPHRHQRRPRKAKPRVYTVEEMGAMLSEAERLNHSMVPLWSSKADEDLVYARSEIEMARPISKQDGLIPSLFRNVTRFRRSYQLMEKTLKVYIYQEGKKPVFHQPNLGGIYASEGWFMKLLESNKHFVTPDPKEAHIFYIPFSSLNLRNTVPKHAQKHQIDSVVEYLKNYIETIAAKYPFWNRTAGADHFLVACHDWGPLLTGGILSTCIRTLCNADISMGFDLGKDVSLPQTKIPNPRIKPLLKTSGKPPSQRKILAFFAGNETHGHLRSILLKHWENVDPNIKVFGNTHRTKSSKEYIHYMQNSKYCICPRGNEVSSPRVVEAIVYECVPVIISDNFVPPLLETLNWSSFAVFVLEKDVSNLKDILLSVSEKRYLTMQKMVKKVQRHFLWNPNRSVRYDLFHMILHSVWYNRVFRLQYR